MNHKRFTSQLRGIEMTRYQQHIRAAITMTGVTLLVLALSASPASAVLARTPHGITSVSSRETYRKIKPR